VNARPANSGPTPHGPASRPARPTGLSPARRPRPDWHRAPGHQRAGRRDERAAKRNEVPRSARTHAAARGPTVSEPGPIRRSNELRKYSLGRTCTDRHGRRSGSWTAWAGSLRQPIGRFGPGLGRNRTTRGDPSAKSDRESPKTAREAPRTDCRVPPAAETPALRPLAQSWADLKTPSVIGPAGCETRAELGIAEPLDSGAPPSRIGDSGGPAAGRTGDGRRTRLENLTETRRPLY
jgi:hypothetical protein